MVSTSCLHLGKVLLSSAEHSRTTLTTSLIAPKALGTRTLQELKRSVPGTPSSYARFTVERCKCIHAIQQTISKAVMHLKESIRLSLCDSLVFKLASIGNALSSPRCEKRTRGLADHLVREEKPRRHGDCMLATRRTLDSSTDHKLAVASRRAVSRATCSFISRTRNTLKREVWPTAPSTDCIPSRCTKQPTKGNRSPILCRILCAQTIV